MSLVKNIGIGKDKWWSYLKDTLHLDCSKCTLRKDETFGYVVDVHGQNIHLSAFPYKNLPDFIKFGNIFDGNFVCSHSKLISMRGFPESIGGNLDITYCVGIQNLDYIPNKIEGDFICIGLGFTEEKIRQCCEVKGKVYC